jgi:hypothetical protein
MRLLNIWYYLNIRGEITVATKAAHCYEPARIKSGQTPRQPALPCKVVSVKAGCGRSGN